MTHARLRRVVVGVLDTNCWIVTASGGNRALVVDPGDDADRVLAACVGLDVVAIVLTHAHFDHVLAVPALLDALGGGVPVLAHPADAPVWPHEVHTARSTGFWDAGTATDAILGRDPDQLRPPDGPLWTGASEPARDGDTVHIGPSTVEFLHTPGHTPGGLTLHIDGHLLTGDTLFPGGPGLTGPPLSDFDAIIGSVRRLLEFPPGTLVHPGHGPDTTIGAERPHLESWIARGW
jgi:glyoxylase-like metal-dependent hydrolase (beta-lactamase superfamily II)